MSAIALVTVSGVVGASFIKSPAEVAASTGAPPPSVITAAVVDKVLSESIALRGVFSTGKALSFTPSAVASTQANAGGGLLVVTGMFVRPGQSVTSGNVIAEVSDRPIYILQGPLPLWRDLRPGESGKDVLELQRALGRLGFAAAYNDSAGYFGAGTESAVKAFYAGIGYAPAVAAASSSSSAGTPTPSTSSDTTPLTAPATPLPSATPSTPPTTVLPTTRPPTTQPSASPPAGSSSQPAYEWIVPMSEAWFIPSLPARVQSVGAQAGSVAPSSLATIAESGLQLTGQLDPGNSSLISGGMRVSISAQVTGYAGTGIVASLGTLTTADGGGAYIPVSIRPSSGQWPQSLNGQNVELTITAISSGKPVLAVPVAAVSSDASGQPEVVVEEANGSEQRVPVQTGMSAGGYVALVGNPPGLAPGVQVVVGH